MILLSRVASYGNTSALQKRGLKSRGKLCPAVIKDRKYGLEAPIFDTKNSTEERKWGRSEENYPVQPKSRKKMPLVGAPGESLFLYRSDQVKDTCLVHHRMRNKKCCMCSSQCLSLYHHPLFLADQRLYRVRTSSNNVRPSSQSPQSAQRLDKDYPLFYASSSSLPFECRYCRLQY